MDLIEYLTRHAPLPLVGIAIFAAMVVSREIGAKLFEMLRPVLLPPEPVRINESHIVAAVLGILLVLIGFGFYLAVDRQETRRDLVVSEASALKTAYLRSQFLEDTPALQSSLRAYTQARLAYGLSEESDRTAKALEASKLQDQVWHDVIAATKPLRSETLPSLISAPINEAFGLADRRNAIADARIPPPVLATIALYLLAITGILGFTTSAAGGQHRVGSFLLFALMASVIILILDIDRPRGGMRVPQIAMSEVLADMKP